MKREQIETYNALRGIAAVMILFSHMSYLDDAINSFWRGVWTYFMHGGAVVTTFFFLSSGFFLFYTWKWQGYGEYLIGKVKRLYPLALIVFLMALAVDVAMSGNDIVNESVRVGSGQWFFNIAANVLLFKAFVPLQSTYYSFHGPSWYISTLFVFYLVGYWFVQGLHGRNRGSWQKYTWGGILFVYTLELIVCILGHIYQWPSLYLGYVNPYFRIFGECLTGVLLCCYMSAIQRRIGDAHVNELEIAGVIVLLLDVVLKNLLGLRVFSAWIQVIPMGYLLIAFRSGKGCVSKALKTKPFQFVGNISFELYMTHAFVYEGLPIATRVVSKNLEKWIVYHAGTRFIITFVLSLITAWVFHVVMGWINRKLIYRRVR